MKRLLHFNTCLPEKILMAWERKRNTETDAKGSRTLEHLMTFLCLEVQGEEMVQLAKSGFGTPIRKKDSPTERVKPTSALASSVKSSDQELPQNIVNKFMKWFNEIQILKDVTVPRCMKIDIFTELHVFVDASKGSYAGCVFARSIVDSRVSVILVRAQVWRVAPLKLLSIPCLELMACCVGARLVNSILKALNMPDLKVTLWSDSTTALWWIKEYGNWSVFVANRVKEIRQLTQIQSWKYVP
ncbi:integrase catalytic domain-containing protein [Trichonephila clavipes]|nr:integrase catalytic domain-containing protein [Trichonephila clavipes]